jgi:hypothetical protein
LAAAQLDGLGNLPLNYAVASGDVETVALVLKDASLTVNEDNLQGATPLHFISTHDWLAAQSIVATEKASIDAEHEKAFFLAQSACYKRIETLLFEHKADINARSVFGTTLRLMITDQSSELVDFL